MQNREMTLKRAEIISIARDTQIDFLNKSYSLSVCFSHISTAVIVVFTKSHKRVSRERYVERYLIQEKVLFA